MSESWNSNSNTSPALTIQHPASHSVLPPGQYVGQVCEVDASGRVKVAISEEGQLLNIDDQCASLPRATVHERCVISVVGSMTMVTQLMLGDRAPFSVSQVGNKLILEADQQYDRLEIRAGETCLALGSNGVVTLQGREINTRAEEHLRLEGDRIDLNLEPEIDH